MKKLTRMKLINWHRFTNELIEFGDSTLLSGENGAGKSTLLDAIQFVVTCSTNSFNKAAHENGKRKLTGYIRCKTGRETRPYERTGQISAHIALEFFDESKSQHFIIGAVVDSASEGQETTVRYLIDNSRLSDGMFFQGNAPRSISQFRAANNNIKQWCKTQTEAKKVIKSRFGRIEDKFFALIPKALAFKPIDDIKDFVYSYVLDEKEVNIDVLRENVRTYQELEKTLESVKKRIEKLEAIEKAHSEVVKGQQNDKMYEYYLERAGLDLYSQKIEELISKIDLYNNQIVDTESELQQTIKEKEDKSNIATALQLELKQDKDFIALEEQRKELSRQEREKEDLVTKNQKLKSSVRTALSGIHKLLQVCDSDEIINRYSEALNNFDNLEDIADFKNLVTAVKKYKRSRSEKIQREKLEKQIKLDQLYDSSTVLKKEIDSLKNKQFPYPNDVNRVLNEIREEFLRIGKKSSPKILCESLEIIDENWRNAVEGYLNTQRFYILVEPDSFDLALGIYDRLRREKKAYGVGLINSGKLDEYDECKDGTLATVVASKNKYAKRFINMVLGKVQMCERFEDLKKYPISITRECMRYQNHVASAIKPEIFSTPYIGQDAYRVQMEMKEDELKRVKEDIVSVKGEADRLASMLPALESDADTEILFQVDVVPRLRQVELIVKQIGDNIATLEKNATMFQKQFQLQELEKIVSELDAKVGAIYQEIGKLRQRLDSAEEEKNRLSEEKNDKSAQVATLELAAGDLLATWTKEYEKQSSNKSYEQFIDNFSRRRKANQTSTDNSIKLMTEVMYEYKQAHDFGASASLEGYPEFASVYERLRTSELLTYEEKVQNAKEAAELEFREQFLAKLQENIKQALAEFKELNKALKDISFSNEKYEFMHLPSKLYRQYYDMIMDDFNAMQGESIFSGAFHQNHQEVIDELFNRLALDKDNDVRALDEFTDYRTYMDYDIRISHSDDTYSLYSKVCEEKSGGETQTPFYVTVAASFVQLYSNNIGGDAVGLVMFDEAFNNMDDERIGGVLEFLRRLPLQIIIAAPPDKIQYITPSVEQTLLVMTDERTSYVERYHNGAI